LIGVEDWGPIFGALHNLYGWTPDEISRMTFPQILNALMAPARFRGAAGSNGASQGGNRVRSLGEAFANYQMRRQLCA
jgi:hypothetical protein